MERSLPYSAYSEPAALDAELKTLFARSWQYAGNVEDLSGGSTAHPTWAGGLPVVLTRANGDIQALVNVCAHRGSIVCAAPTDRDSLTCPYHAWRYALDGTLISAPRSDREDGFDPGKVSLERLPVGRWGPFIFVGLSDAVMPFEEYLGDLPSQVEAAGIDVDNLVFHHRAQFALEANWKIVTENFLECYHCRVAHPAFSKAIDTSPDSYELSTTPTYSTQRAPTRDSGRSVIDLRGEIPRAQFHLLYPNTAINILAGRPNISIGPINPAGPARTERYLDYFFGPGVPSDWVDEMLAFDNQVGKEDEALVESMQRGIDARPQRRGILFMDSERLIHHFESYLLGYHDYE